MPKTLTVEPIIIDLTNDQKINEFLNVQKKHTKNVYSTFFKRVKEFSNENGNQMLANRKQWIKKIFELHAWLLSKGYSMSYAQSACGMVRGFFSYYRKPLLFTHVESKRLGERKRKTQDYLFSKDDLKRLWFNANLKEKWILCNKSFGLRASDFSRITFGMLRQLKLDKNDVPILLSSDGIDTEKESIRAYPMLDYDGLEVVKAILEQNTNAKDHDYVLMTKSKRLHNTYQKINPCELSRILRQLAKKSGIQNGNARIRFHNLRKYCINALASVMSESKWKTIIGKKCSESAYISTIDLKEAFKKALPLISLMNGNGEVIKAELSEQKSTIEQLLKLLQQKDSEIKQLKAQMEQHNKTMNETLTTLNERLTTIEKKTKKINEPFEFR
jgi:hypothetical protein